MVYRIILSVVLSILCIYGAAQDFKLYSMRRGEKSLIKKNTRLLIWIILRIISGIGLLIITFLEAHLS